MTKRTVAATIAALILCSACSMLFEAKISKLNADLRLAACDGDIRKVENALQRGAKINSTDGQGSSALIDAESCGYHDRLTKSRVQLIELLIATGAELNHQDDDGRSALMFAARNGDTQAVTSLLRNGATVNLADKDGETALMKAAASSCNEETVTALLRAGSDLNARDHKGRSALETFRASYACPDSKVGDLLGTAAAKNR